MDPKETVKFCEKSIEELRRMYDEICSVYARLKNLNLTLVGGSLAFLSYLYSGNDAKNPLFFPTILYGQIFYCTGVVLYFIGFFFLLFAMVPVDWETPTERKKHKTKDFKSYAHFIEYTKNRYIESIDWNLSQFSKRQRQHKLGTTFVFVAAIVLLILKIFGKETL